MPETQLVPYLAFANFKFFKPNHRGSIRSEDLTMSTQMEHDDSALEQQPLHSPNSPPLPPRSDWSAEPFSGSPSTVFTVTSVSGITTFPPPSATTTGTVTSPTGWPAPGPPILSASPPLEEFTDIYDNCVMSTDLLMVCYLPDDISHPDFCDTMDRIQRHLKVHKINNYYCDSAFAAKFTPPASWADDGLSYPEERHNSFFLRLGGPLPFRYNGLPGEHYRTMVFSLPVSPVLDNRPNRWLVIQPVFSDANTEYLRPHMAVWRGAGLDAGFGNAGAALLLTKLYIYECQERWRAADPNCEWICYSFLSVHKVDIKAPAKPPPGAGESRRGGTGRGRGRTSRTNARATEPTSAAPADPGPTQAHYGELFIITVCTAPISQISHCFESLIPPGAAFGLPLYPIRFCGMWMELARGLEYFRTTDKKVAPGLELITPCPTTRLRGLKAGATLSKIIAALGQDGQDNFGILGGFLHRTSGGDSCTLITEGPRLLCTPSLRPLSSSLSLIEESDIDDMKRLRERYCIFRRAVGLPTTLDLSAVPPVTSLATALTCRPPRTPPATFSEVVRSLPMGIGDQLRTMVTDVIQQEVAAANRQTNARVDELAAAHRKTETTQKLHADSITTLEAKQTEDHNSITGLQATQQTVEEAITASSNTVRGLSAALASHTQLWKELDVYLTDQSTQMESIKSSMNSLFKRRHEDTDRDSEVRPAPASPGHGTAH